MPFEQPLLRWRADEKQSRLQTSSSGCSNQGTIFPLVNNAEMNAVSHEIYKSLTKLAVSVKLTPPPSPSANDTRADLRRPFAITVDRRTIGHTSTPKDADDCARDSCEQVRIKADEVAEFISDLSLGGVEWKKAKASLRGRRQRQHKRNNNKTTGKFKSARRLNRESTAVLCNRQREKEREGGTILITRESRMYRTPFPKPKQIIGL